jgi:DNA (cytosine-5)-methyltransferase 1
MTVGSLFAGIGGFDLGFERAGFRVRWQAEQDNKAQAVLGVRFSGARIYDDVKAIDATAARVDVICGGFPCQDVSVAGKREGLGGARTGLFWEVVRIARTLEPRWMVLENVPGLLSSRGGRDFHAVMQALAECGFRRAYRILDSRYFGVPQRRRRVFLVLRARGVGDGPESVLFESTRGGRDSAAGRQARAHVARGTGDGATFALRADLGGTGQAHNTTYIAATLKQRGRGCTDEVMDNLQLVAGPLGGGNDGIGRRTEDDPDLVYAATLNSGGNTGGFRTEPGEHLIVPERAHALVASMHKRHDDDIDTLNASHGTQLGNGHNTTYPTTPSGVRRLTPLECERLQGFPDGWTCLCGEGHRGSSFCACPDSPRYRQLGNAVTVPVAEWIARRIAATEAA